MPGTEHVPSVSCSCHCRCLPDSGGEMTTSNSPGVGLRCLFGGSQQLGHLRWSLSRTAACELTRKAKGGAWKSCVNRLACTRHTSTRPAVLIFLCSPVSRGSVPSQCLYSHSSILKKKKIQKPSCAPDTLPRCQEWNLLMELTFLGQSIRENPLQ